MNTILATAEAKPGGDTLAGRWLALTLGDEACAVPVHRVREIVRLPSFTGGAASRGPVQGVINLRGRTIPVLDLRPSAGNASVSSDRTCIVVLQPGSAQAGAGFVGLVVDAVEEVIDIESSQIAALADVGSRIDAACLLGRANIHGVVKTLLDVDRAAALGRIPRRGSSLLPRVSRTLPPPIGR